MRFVNRTTSVALLRCPLGPKEKNKKQGQEESHEMVVW